MRTGKLTVKGVESILSGKVSGRYHGDGGGLWLVVTKRDENGKALAASYVYRFYLTGKSREMGLGSAWDIKLADAREKARQHRVRVRTEAVDVLSEKREKIQARVEAAKVEAARRMTFKQAATSLIRSKEAGWRNDKHRWQWSNSLERFAYPVVGDMAVRDVDTASVVKVIEPLWSTKTETASRLRGRIEAILDWSRVAGYREGDNPARWKGHLEHLLPAKSKVAPVEHHAALDYRQIGQFVAELRQQEGIAARALEFAILCWSRSGEVIGAKWTEFDLTEKIWTIPGERKKAGREHRVPLCGRALAILGEMAKIREHRPSEFVFQGQKDGSPLSNMSMLMLLRRMGHTELTTHGFRATARTWGAERTNFPHELLELTLAHTVSEKAVAAYIRGDGMAKRRQLAEAWCRYVDEPAQNGSNVVAIGAA